MNTKPDSLYFSLATPRTDVHLSVVFAERMIKQDFHICALSRRLKPFKTILLLLIPIYY